MKNSFVEDILKWICLTNETYMYVCMTHGNDKR